ncbi:uncharacterized protein TNCT_494441 [Trichonephila clavata]|uniref:Uncharacterized protein n=1 Tax=Trichonephila clavata TaxID=2740835 RepID=A0A8X6LVN0_TRICU|nr:uncharacterized protein TNCT_494441 [Trichonephila clavata]
MIFILLQLIGIDVFDYYKDNDSHPSNLTFIQTNLTKSRIVFCMKICSRCFFFILLCVKYVVYTLRLFFVWNRVWEYTTFFVTAVMASIYGSVLIRRRAILHMVENLNQIHQKFSGHKPIRGKYFFIVYFIFSQILVTIWGFLLYYSGGSIKPQDIKQKAIILSDYLEPRSFLVIFEHVQALYNFSQVFIISVFAMFYSFTCKCIRDLTRCLLDQQNKNCSPEEIEALISLHVDIMKCMNFMDDNFSYFAFATVFVSMMGTFWSGYRLVFCKTLTAEYFFFKLCLIIINCSTQLLIMLSASFTNELTEEATRRIQCLLCRIPAKREIKCNLKCDLTQPSSLTLWKIYVMDRSLIISSYASLLTFGILLGALGNSQ